MFGGEKTVESHVGAPECRRMPCSVAKWLVDRRTGKRLLRVSQRSDNIQIEEQAARWLARRNDGGCSENDEAEFQAWLEQSTGHVVAYLRLQAAWQQAARLKALNTGRSPALEGWRFTSFSPDTPAVGETEANAQAKALSKRRAPVLSAIAASVVLAVVSATVWYLWPIGQNYRTPVGGFASVPMKDGSNITLNTDSQIRIAVTETERHVDLQQGEAFFEVAKDPQRPFIVTVGKRRVIAVGTAFSVYRDGDDVRVAITEGRVKIEDTAASPAAEQNFDTDILTISAGTVARATNDGVLVQKKPIPEIEGDLSWRTGYLSFRDTTLAAVVAEFNRYNDAKIFIEDPTIASIRVSGKFRSTQFDAFIRLLEQGFPVQARNSGGEIFLMDNRRGANRGAMPEA